jgi:hypothetical protein
MWYINSGAYLHMKRVHEHLTYLTKIGYVEVVLGYDRVVKAVG